MAQTVSGYWDAQARRYDRATLLLCRDFDAMAAAIAARVADCERVLEVAAGTGLVTRAAAPGVQRYLATDASEAMLEILKGRLGDLPGLQVGVADAMALDGPDDQFDAVLACNLLHLLPDPVGCLKELRRVLAPGGRLLTPTFCHGEGTVARVVSGILGLSGFPIHTRFSGEELDELVTSAGFTITEARWFQGLLPIRYVEAR